MLLECQNTHSLTRSVVRSLDDSKRLHWNELMNERTNEQASKRKKKNILKKFQEKKSPKTIFFARKENRRIQKFLIFFALFFSPFLHACLVKWWVDFARFLSLCLSFSYSPLVLFHICRHRHRHRCCPTKCFIK